jgi:hypothetical protein
MATLALSEMLTHSSDLARATGQRMSVDDLDVNAVLATKKPTLKPAAPSARLRTRDSGARQRAPHRPPSSVASRSQRDHVEVTSVESLVAACQDSITE